MQQFKMTMQLMSRKYRTLHKELRLFRRYSQPALAANVSNASSACLCDKSPTEQTMDDYLKMHSISDTELNGVLYNAAPRRFMNLCKAIHYNMVLLRKPSLSIIDILRESELTPPPKILIHGPDGGGKSITLMQIIQYCLQKKMVVIHVPNAYRFVDGQGFTEVQQSQWNPSRFDQPHESIIWLKMFRTMNSQFLTEAKTTQGYQWGKRESTEKDQPLMEVLEQGVGRNMYANDVVGVLLKEIRLNTEVEVLYAVDAVNGLFGATSHTFDYKPVDLNSLSLVHHFTKLLKPEYSLNKGAYVMATSRSIQFLKPASKIRTLPMIDQLFDQSAISRLGDFVDVEVPLYNEEEFIKMLNFYSEKGWLARGISDKVIKEIRFVTNRNPNLIRQVLTSL